MSDWETVPDDGWENESDGWETVEQGINFDDLLKRERTNYASLSLDEKKQLYGLRKSGQLSAVNRGTTEEHAQLAAKGMSIPEKVWTGFGGTLPNIGTGLQKLYQDVGRGMSRVKSDVPTQSEIDLQSEIDESKAVDQGLGGWGTTGRVLGNIGLTAPILAVPGSNTYAGAALTGAVLGAIQPVATGESRAFNATLGAAAGAGGQLIGKKVIPAVVNAANRKIAELAAKKTANAARDATIQTSREAGYVIPPSEVNPTFLSNRLEGWAGKASVGQQASIKNQEVTNKLVRESLGLPENTPVTKEAIEPLKQAAWKVYDQTRNLGTFTTDKEFSVALKEIAKMSTKLNPVPEIDNLVSRLSQKTIEADDVVNAIRTFRANAADRLNPLNRDVASRTLGKAEAKSSEMLEGLLERNAPGEFLPQFKEARRMLGKVGTVERALNDATGDINARVIGREFSKGKPLTEELKKVGKFAAGFPRYVQQNVNPIQGGSPLDTGLAMGTAAVTQNPTWLAMALGRPLARSMALGMNPIPKYKAGVLTRGASNLGLLADKLSEKDKNLMRGLLSLTASNYAVNR